MSETNYAVAIAVHTPSGIPLVSDPKKPVPRYWKLPGGRSMPGEVPEETAIRELREETGIALTVHDLTLLHEEHRADHGFFLFSATVIRPVTLPEKGGDGELVQIFAEEKIRTMPDFFPNHRVLAHTFLK